MFFLPSSQPKIQIIGVKTLYLTHVRGELEMVTVKISHSEWALMERLRPRSARELHALALF